MRTVGRNGRDLRMALKSGNFGGRMLAPRFVHDSIKDVSLGDETTARDEICEVGLPCSPRPHSSGSTGNISVRTPRGWLAHARPTNASLGSDPANLSKFDDDNRLVSGGKTTKEAFLHFSCTRSGRRPRDGAAPFDPFGGRELDFQCRPA